MYTIFYYHIWPPASDDAAAGDMTPGRCLSAFRGADAISSEAISVKSCFSK